MFEASMQKKEARSYSPAPETNCQSVLCLPQLVLVAQTSSDVYAVTGETADLEIGVHAIEGVAEFSRNMRVELVSQRGAREKDLVNGVNGIAIRARLMYGKACVFSIPAGRRFCCCRCYSCWQEQA